MAKRLWQGTEDAAAHDLSEANWHVKINGNRSNAGSSCYSILPDLCAGPSSRDTIFLAKEEMDNLSFPSLATVGLDDSIEMGDVHQRDPKRWKDPKQNYRTNQLKVGMSVGLSVAARIIVDGVFVACRRPDSREAS